MKCSEIQNLLSTYYDNEVSTELRESIASHLEGCSDCRSELVTFKNLSASAARFEPPRAPESVWPAVERNLDSLNRESRPREFVAKVTETEDTERKIDPLIRFAAAIAVTLFVGFVASTLWHGDHRHEKMVTAMEQVAAEIDSDNITTLLLKQFGGSELASYQDAITLVGYRPVASEGLPEGYSIESIQVLDMPCCKCIQTACQRPDKTRFFIYEHDNEETGWFEQRDKREAECSGKTCEIVELNNRLAVTWQKDSRHVTLLGVRDKEEIERLVSLFEQKS